MTRRALFLDRDGVINVDHGYVFRQDQFEFVEGIVELCRCATKLGYLIIVVTNQAGIGRGLYSEQQFLDLTEWMCGALRKRGASIAKVYFCPFHPQHGVGSYKVDSTDRKPGPGMILQAAKEFDIDLKRSVLVGDKESDIQAGICAGIGCNLLYLPPQDLRRTDPSTAANSTVRNLAEVQSFLTGKDSPETPSQHSLGAKST